MNDLVTPSRRSLIVGAGAAMISSQAHAATAAQDCLLFLCKKNNGGGGGGVQPQIVSSGGELPHATDNLSTRLGYATRFQGRIRMLMGYQPVKWMKLVFPGFVWGGAGEVNNPNVMPLQVAIEFPSAPNPNPVQCTFGGSTQGSIPIGAAQYMTDQINPASFGWTTFPANAVWYFRFLQDFAIGQNNFSSVGRDVIDVDCSVQFGPVASYVNYLLTAGPMGSSGATGNGNSGNPPGHVLKPLAVIGVPTAPMISVLTTGDSIMQGALGSAYPNLSGGGYLSNGLCSVNGHAIPWMSLASYGTLATQYNTDAVKMKTYYQYCTHAVSEAGSNDSSASTAYPALQSIWASFKSTSGTSIKHVEQTLILPRDNSTDTWATLANQTYSNSSLRDVLNPDITGNVGSNGLDAYFDIQGSFVSPFAPWSGAANKFPVTGSTGSQQGPTVDGTHPTDPLARMVMAPVVAARAASWLQTNVTGVPVNTSLPIILGPRYQGSSLTVTTGQWGLGATAYLSLSYQWYSAGVVVVGATSSSYTLQAGDVGNVITCQVTATNGIGSTTVTTAATATVLGSGITVPSFPASGVVTSSASISSGAGVANATITGSQTDPLSGTTAAKVAYSSTANNAKVVNYAAAAVTDGVRYTASIYAKAVEYQYFYMQSASKFPSFTYFFDALNGLVLGPNTFSSINTPTPDQVGVIPMPNGWYRFFITYTAVGSYTGANSLWFGPMATNSGNPNSPGAGTIGSGLLFWRVQLATGGIDS